MSTEPPIDGDRSPFGRYVESALRRMYTFIAGAVVEELDALDRRLDGHPPHDPELLRYHLAMKDAIERAKYRPDPTTPLPPR